MNKPGDEQEPADKPELPEVVITSRAEFHSALRSAFNEAAQVGSRELWLMDIDFADWPLGESEVIAQLERWVSSTHRLTLIAHRFDAVAARHPRWVNWRRNWSHVVSCRSNSEIGADDLTTLLLASETVTVRLTDNVHYRGLHSHRKAESLCCRELIDAVLQRSEETFPVTSMGL